MKKVTIKPQREASLQRFHPWIFSGSIHSVEKGTKNGDVISLINVKGEKLAIGHYCDGSIGSFVNFCPRLRICPIYLHALLILAIFSS